MAPCKPVGGNDSSMCVLCGVEFEHGKEPEPPCGRDEKIKELLAQRRAIDEQMYQLYAVTPPLPGGATEDPAPAE